MIVIEKGIPCPYVAKNVFLTLEVGDSFRVERKESRNFRQYVYQWNKRGSAGKFLFRRHEDAFRVWRVE
jgi:hypothetical protein